MEKHYKHLTLAERDMITTMLTGTHAGGDDEDEGLAGDGNVDSSLQDRMHLLY